MKKVVIYQKSLPLSLAGVEGLEPSQAVLETDVLPLTLYPYEFVTIIIIAYK